MGPRLFKGRIIILQSPNLDYHQYRQFEKENLATYRGVGQIAGHPTGYS